MAESRESSEWQRSADAKERRRRRQMPGTATGSAPALGVAITIIYPGVAQLVARLLWEQDAAGSSPVTWTKRPKSTSVGFGCFVYCGKLQPQYPASKAGYLLWAKTLCAAGGRRSRAFCVQRSIKSRISASPMILSGTANRRHSRGCCRFESCHLDQEAGMA